MDTFNLNLKGEGISVERAIDRTTALAVLNLVLGNPSDMPTPGAASLCSNPQDNGQTEKADLHPAKIEQTGAPPKIEKPLSIREFVDRYKPKTNAQIILCIAKYMEEHEGLARFGRAQIKRKFPSVGEQPPKNYSRDFQTAIDKGWIGEDTSSIDQYFVTRTGETQLQQGFKSRRN